MRQMSITHFLHLKSSCIVWQMYKVGILFVQSAQIGVTIWNKRFCSEEARQIASAYSLYMRVPRKTGKKATLFE